MLLFIKASYNKASDLIRVSIHLMLLFISARFCLANKHSKFQYISCCYLSIMLNSKHLEKQVSIHLMLLFILWKAMLQKPIPQVSIHLMLLFISLKSQRQRLWIHVSIHLMLLFIEGSYMTETMPQARFNTSHVVIYRSHFLLVFPTDNSFNTSHVVIYPLSILSLLGVLWGFNTSHVVIYLFLDPSVETIMVEFQYISCCYLSFRFPTSLCSIPVSIHLMLLFIKIRGDVRQLLRCFNTSHVVIYLGVRTAALATVPGFNTSHVVIYQKIPLSSCGQK